MKRTAIYDTGAAYVVETSEGLVTFYDKSSYEPIGKERPIDSFLAHSNGYLNPVNIEFDEPE